MKNYKIAFVGLGSIATRHLKNVYSYLASQGDSCMVDLYRISLGRPLAEELQPLVSNTYLYADEIPADRQYDVVFDSGSKEASEEDKITKLWSQTLPALLMAPSEEEFDTLFEEFIEKRDELGYTDVMEKKTAYMNSAKEKLGIQ